MQSSRFGKSVNIFLGMCILTICIQGCGKKHVAGVPDVIGSFKINRDANLIVVANRDVIEDKEDFAKLLIDTCINNSFQSTKFTNYDGYATSLVMEVYLWEDEIEGHKPVMHVEYKPIEYGKDYDIVNHTEMFTLFIDGDKIEEIARQEIY